MKIGIQVYLQAVSEMTGFRFAQILESSHKKGSTGRWSQKTALSQNSGVSADSAPRPGQELLAVTPLDLEMP